jgi:hypothetical protein
LNFNGPFLLVSNIPRQSIMWNINCNVMNHSLSGRLRESLRSSYLLYEVVKTALILTYLNRNAE